MDHNSPGIVSRAELARYAGVSRAAVTNWIKRSADFPAPTDEMGSLFSLDQVLEWLSAREVPARARHPHEPAGTTYSDRVRSHTDAGVPRTDTISGEGPAADTDSVRTVVSQILDSLRGPCPGRDAALLVAALAYLRATHEDRWNDLCKLVHHGAADGRVFMIEFGDFFPPFLSNSFESLNPDVFTTAVLGVDSIAVQPGQHSELLSAFEHALTAMEKIGDSNPDFSTPPSVVRMTTALLANDGPLESVYDPCCRTGEFLVSASQAQSRIDPPGSPRFSATELNWQSLGIAKMHTLLRGMVVQFDNHPKVPWASRNTPGTADLVLANPPFNMYLPSPDDLTHQSLRYGTPPRRNANFLWLQFTLSCLTPNGRAGVLMANSASHSMNAKEAAIRSGMVEDGAVECVIALPDRLFRGTAIPVTLWVLRAPTGSREEILFIDASKLGRMDSRTHRVLEEEDVEQVHGVYSTWRNGRQIAPQEHGGPAISHIATLQEIRDKRYSLHPPAYVPGNVATAGPAEQVDSLNSLIRHLESLESQIPQVDSGTEQLLTEVRRWIRP